MSAPLRAAAGAAVLTVCITTAAVHAQESGEALAEAARCYMCHQLDQPLLGPPYLAIAARHAARRDVMVDVLAQKIVAGGGGTWGVVPMVPNQWVTLEQARAMAEWILSLAPE